MQAETEAPLITNRWVPLHVSTIESIHIVNKRYFQEDERITCPGKEPMSLYGKLKEADLKVTFTLPYAVPKNQLSSYICRCTGFFSEDLNVKIGYITDMTTMEPKLQEPQRFSILVPLLRGYFFKKPALDYINVSEHEWVHFTLCFAGALWPSMKPTCWRIRIKVSQLEDRIECVSVSSNPVDVPRMREGWGNLTCWLKDLPQKLAPFLPFSRSTVGYGPQYGQQVWGTGYAGSGYQQQFQAASQMDRSGIAMNLPRATGVSESYQQ